MSDSTEISPDDHILADFIRELDQLGIEKIDVNRWAENYPHMEERFRRLLSTHFTLDDARLQEEQSIPKQLGEFKIERRIAQGGMGDVFEAIQISLNRRVAVKTIRNAKLSPEVEQRFLREQKILGALHQTHIVPIHTAGIQEGFQYFAMPYIEGAALSHVVKRLGSSQFSRSAGKTPALGELACEDTDEFNTSGQKASGVEVRTQESSIDENQLSPNRLSVTYLRSVAKVMADVAEAVHHAHQCQILHRDIKPSNIMVDAHEQSWIIDFGLAKYLTEEFDAFAQTMTPDKVDHFQTQVKALGTPAYMAPEQFEGQADVRSDVYGLGVTLYELLTLQRAFNGESFQAFKQAIEHSEPPRPRQLAPGLPADLEAICLKAMHKNPAQRYRTASEFAMDLHRFLNGEPVAARPAWVLRRTAKWAQRNKGWATAIISIIFIALFSLVFLEREASIARRELETQLKEKERQSIILNVSQSFVDAKTRFSEWVRDARNRLKEAHTLREGNDLTELYCGTLSGIDASVRESWRIPGSRVAFNHDDTRLLIGHGQQSATVIDLETNQATLLSGVDLNGGGAIGFDAADHPIRVVAVTPQHFQVEDLQTGEIVSTFTASIELAQPSVAPARHSVINANRLIQSTPEMSRVVAWAKRTKDSDHTPTSGVVLVWDRTLGKVIREIEADATALAISRGGKFIAVGDSEGTVTIYDVEGDRESLQLRIGTQQIAAIDIGSKPEFSSRTRFSKLERSQSFLAVADRFGAISVWDLSSGAPVMLQREIVHQVNAIKFASGGTMVATASHHRVQLWDVYTGLPILRHVYTSHRNDLAFSSDDSLMAVPGVMDSSPDQPTSQIGTQLWEYDRSRGIKTLRGMPHAGVKVVFSQDGTQVAALSNDWTIGIWDVETERLLHRLQAPPGLTVDNSALRFSPDAQKFWFSAGSAMTEWNLTNGQITNQWKLLRGLQDRISKTPDGRLLLMRYEGVSRLQEMKTGGGISLIWEDPTFDRRIISIEGTADGEYFVLDGESSQLREGANRLIAIVNGHEGKLERIVPSTSRNGSTVTPIADGADYFIQMAQLEKYDAPAIRVGLKDGVTLGELPHFFTAVSSNGRYGFFVDSDQKIVDIYDLQNERLLFRYPSRTTISPYQPSFSSDGAKIAWSNTDGTVNVCEIDRVLKELEQAGLSWNPD